MVLLLINLPNSVAYRRKLLFLLLKVFLNICIVIVSELLNSHRYLETIKHTFLHSNEYVRHGRNFTSVHRLASVLLSSVTYVANGAFTTT